MLLTIILFFLSASCSFLSASWRSFLSSLICFCILLRASLFLCETSSLFSSWALSSWCLRRWIWASWRRAVDLSKSSFCSSSFTCLNNRTYSYCPSLPHNIHIPKLLQDHSHISVVPQPVAKLANGYKLFHIGY